MQTAEINTLLDGCDKRHHLIINNSNNNNNNYDCYVFLWTEIVIIVGELYN
jgi:hypothetical protein